MQPISRAGVQPGGAATQVLRIKAPVRPNHLAVRRYIFDFVLHPEVLQEASLACTIRFGPRAVAPAGPVSVTLLYQRFYIPEGGMRLARHVPFYPCHNRRPIRPFSPSLIRQN